MNCEPEQLVAYALGDLEDQENEALALHIQECRSCAERLVELRATLGVIRTLPEAENRPVSMARLHQAIGLPGAAAERPRPTLSRLLPQWRWGFALATAAALAFMCFHYGLAVRIGQFEVAFGGTGRAAAMQPSPAVPENAVAMDAEAMRGVAREEIASQVGPALVRLTETIQNLDERQSQALVGLRNSFLLQRAADMGEVNRNLMLIGSTMNDTLGGR